MVATTNLLLDSLSPDSLREVLALTKLVDLPTKKFLHQAEIVPRYAYFLTQGLASVVASSAEGGTVEVGIVGREGVGGAIHLLGPGAVPTQCFMQLPGAALRIRMEDLQRLFHSLAELRTRVLEFVQQEALTLGQIAGCHRLHEAEPRLVRWLLMVQDRVHLDVLELKQSFLAEMLGSQRTTISSVAGELQKKGLIEYSRGHLRILDRRGLEAAACGCYAVTHRLLDGLYKEVAPG